HYGGHIRSLSFFPGKYYEFPAYEVFLWAGACTVWAALRYFRDDKGMTLAERGVDRLKAVGQARTGLRCLALVGVVNIIMLAYNLAFGLMALQGDDWPADIQSRSYLTNGLCGP